MWFAVRQLFLNLKNLNKKNNKSKCIKKTFKNKSSLHLKYFSGCPLTQDKSPTPNYDMQGNVSSTAISPQVPLSPAREIYLERLCCLA